MMITLMALAIAHPAETASLPGIADEETQIGVTQRQLRNVVRGNGDVLFVQDRTNRWYRVALNEGCTDNVIDPRPTVKFGARATTIDQGSNVYIGDFGSVCKVTSVRRSETPPQYDSDSIVTLD
ncbi:hypothetical protein [Sphingomicrobium sediminis]|uniref:Uncharacterized protein n=1 Tax=Sphingomicrobium sediminis TaxID=2950949 RepID=A0A9X2J3K0_9SPHN|nr:hypothetical protein [Sphingomicrobium sediminis]MCM8556287.1 hypothetical protein [Sphingomicrobium sediminis]